MVQYIYKFFLHILLPIATFSRDREIPIEYEKPLTFRWFPGDCAFETTYHICYCSAHDYVSEHECSVTVRERYEGPGEVAHGKFLKLLRCEVWSMHQVRAPLSHRFDVLWREDYQDQEDSKKKKAFQVVCRG